MIITNNVNTNLNTYYINKRCFFSVIIPSANFLKVMDVFIGGAFSSKFSCMVFGESVLSYAD